MTERDYLAKLASALRGLADTDEILSDIAAHFAEGRAAGRNDHEITLALGNPSTLAREYQAQALARDSSDNPGIVSSARLLAHGFAMKFPGSKGAILAGIAGLACGGLVFFLIMLIFRGAAGFYAGLGSSSGEDLESKAVAVSQVLRPAGFGLLGITGLLALVSGLVESGKRSRIYIKRRAARKGSAASPRD